MEQPGFWNDQASAQAAIDEANAHKRWVDAWKGLRARHDDLIELHDMAQEEGDAEALAEVERDLASVEREIGDLEFRNMLDDPDDELDALLTIHPGAGGTESNDWAQMLMRMYLRWAERQGFVTEALDLLPGEEAGIKSATIEVKGKYAYGYLKAEAGVHRLVRISPFDSNSRRHTSFASVFVYPDKEGDVEIEIKEEDLKIDTYRSGGAGGQHVNKTSSAVRITHLPTGIVAQCQNERSQHKNRGTAMKILKARLYQRHKEEEQKKLDVIESTKKKIEWGSQIRSYVFHPYNMVKDHRTEAETGNVSAVMDGDLDRFIHAYLSQNSRKVVST
jgi:peptide chain release factor 2